MAAASEGAGAGVTLGSGAVIGSFELPPHARMNPTNATRIRNMIDAAAVGIDRDIPMLIVVGLACSFDSSGAGGGATIGAHDTETGTGTSSGTPTSSTGLDATATTTSEGPP